MVPGGNGDGSDRAGTVEASFTTRGIHTWYGLDLTGLVQRWVSGELANSGLMLRSPYSTGSYYFASAENANMALRPRLVVGLADP